MLVPPPLTTRCEAAPGAGRGGVAAAGAPAGPRHVVIMDEPTAALGVKESAQVLELIGRVRDRGLPVVLISHNMPHVFEIADRIHIQRLGRRVALVDRSDHTMAEVVAIMTGALRMEEQHTVVADEAAAAAAGVEGSTST